MNEFLSFKPNKKLIIVLKSNIMVKFKYVELRFLIYESLKKISMSKKQTIKLLKEKRNRLVSQWWAGIILAEISFFVLLYFYIIDSLMLLFFIAFIFFIMGLLSTLTKTTPYQLKETIHDVDLELSKYSAYEKIPIWKYIK